MGRNPTFIHDKQLFSLSLTILQYDRVGILDKKGEWDPKKRAKEIIAKLDISGDKKLSKEEFITGFVFIIFISISYLYLSLDV